jgi:2-keto-3-deoxy-L-fuconate dehydrogenase
MSESRTGLINQDKRKLMESVRNGAFDGRVVVITGGTAGIGLACAEHFAAVGADVSVIGRSKAQNISSEITVYQADVTDQDALNSVMNSIAGPHGRIDVLVNNAGKSFVGDVETGSIEEWKDLWDVNVLGYVRSTRAALPHLRRSTSAAIINMSSCTADSGLRQRALYSATKGAIDAMTRAEAADLVVEGITVNAVSPGTVDTPFMEELAARAENPEDRRRSYENRQPTGRMVTPAEVALTVAYLAHPANRSTIGTVVTIDGGIAALHLTDA